MTSRTFAGLALLVIGLFALACRGFTFTRDSHHVDFGPFQVRYDEKERVDIPLWAGVAGVVAGTALLVVPGSTRRTGP